MFEFDKNTTSCILLEKGGFNMFTIFQVAKWFFNKENDISPKKLQKLCWYAYSWYIALTYDVEEKSNDYLFNENAEAWVHGPVFRVLFTDYKYHEYERTMTADDITNVDTIDFLNDIYEVYGKFSGFELESLTHQERPWLEARRGLDILEASNNIISKEDIINEYLPRLKSNL